MSQDNMSTYKNDEDTPTNSYIQSTNDTGTKLFYEASETLERVHNVFDQILEKRNAIVKDVEESKKDRALDTLACLLADLKELHYWVMTEEHDEQVDNNKSYKKEIEVPASRGDILALQKQITQLCNGAKQCPAPPAATESHLRAEVASLKETVANFSNAAKEDKEEQRVAVEKFNKIGNLLCERLPALMAEVWEAAKEPNTRRATLPKIEDSSSEEDTPFGKLRAKRRADDAAPMAARAARAGRSAMYARGNAGDDESDSETEGLPTPRGKFSINPIPADDWVAKVVNGTNGQGVGPSCPQQ